MLFTGPQRSLKVEGEIENKEDEPNTDDENEEVKNLENKVQKEKET